MGAAVVTGAARGIGEAIARAYVAAGGSVLLTDIEDDRGEALAADLGPRARYRHADVTREDDIQAAIAAAQEEFGPLDAVFANAGAVGVIGRIEETSLEEWRATIDLLLTGVFLTVKHAVAAMRPHRRGAIVCTGSVAGVRGGLGPHAYTAAKSGVRGLVESVAVEIAPYGLRINAVAPGGTVTSLPARMRFGDPDALDAVYARLAAASSSGVPTTAADVAAAALFLAGPSASRINGACLVIDGGDDVLSTKGRSYYS